MLIRLFDFLNAYPYQRALQSVGLPYELHTSPREVWEAWRKHPGNAALLPFAKVAYMPKGLSRWGIGSRGAVQSVLLLSEGPPQHWGGIRIDRRSISSAAILYHLRDLGFLSSLPIIDSGESCPYPTADLIIGDDALRLAPTFPYKVDLGEVSYRLLRRGNVFAVWWVDSEHLQQLDKIWRRFSPPPASWIEEAALRYGFSAERVRSYWRSLRYRLPPLGRAYWRRTFRRMYDSLSKSPS
ncbi:MAG: hypothetical protein N3E49_02965 [Bacteroidia bacterium]|nr:hypothetical protein [Bacteroidia bacterium]